MRLSLSVFFLFILALISNCKEVETTEIQSTVDEYYSVYAERQDFDRFLAFYDSSMVLEDMIFGVQVEGIEIFRDFFDWPNPNFELLDSVALVVKSQVIDQNEVVTSGYFTPFRWGGIDVEAMQFTTILTFNTEGKIIRHVDWINYPAYLVNYETRENSNRWINTNE